MHSVSGVRPFSFGLLGMCGAASLAALWPAIALAQAAGDQTGGAGRDSMVGGLMYFTLIATLVIAVAAFAFFLRKRSNREATRPGLDIDAGRD